MPFSVLLVALCLTGVMVSRQTVLFLAVLLSAVLGLVGVMYDYCLRGKLREARRWRELLRYKGHPNFDDFDREWKARGLPWPRSSQAWDDEAVKTDSIIEALERKSDSQPLIFTGIAAAFAIFAAVLAYLLIP
jgi:hypothetical protein